LFFDIPLSKTNKVKVTFTNTDRYGIQLAEILLLIDPADLVDWVENNDDCDDTNAAIYPAAECGSQNDGCTGLIDSSCTCAIHDSDSDGVCDTLDICPGEDDTVDLNKDGIPDCNQEHVCVYEDREFATESLKATSEP